MLVFPVNKNGFIFLARYKRKKEAFMTVVTKLLGKLTANELVEVINSHSSKQEIVKYLGKYVRKSMTDEEVGNILVSGIADLQWKALIIKTLIMFEPGVNVAAKKAVTIEKKNTEKDSAAADSCGRTSGTRAPC